MSLHVRWPVFLYPIPFFALLFALSYIPYTSSYIPIAHANITTGLVGHWKFDEGSGITAGDSSGNNNTGTLTNGPTWTTGKLGGALSFDGNDSVDALNVTEITGYPFTLSAWVNGSNAADAVAFSASQASGGGVPWYGIGQDNTGVGQIVRRPGVGSGEPWDYNGSVSITGGWHHLVGVFVNSTDLLLYVDGVEDVNTSFSHGGFGSIDKISIGRMGDSTPSDYYTGSIDDVRVYSRALSSSDIAELYAYTGGTPSPPTPVNGSCGSTNNSCTAGTLNDITDSSTHYLWQCVGSGGGSTASCSLPIPATPTTYTLSVSKNGTGAGTVSGTPSTGSGQAVISCGTDCSETVNSGTSITLSATPTTGSTFAGWSGGNCSGTGSCTVTLTANMAVTATFNTSSTPPPSSGTTVSNASELAAALNAATGGETILLNSGNYGSLNITRNFSSYVTLKSVVPLGTVFSSLNIPGGSYIRLDGLVVQGSASSAARIDGNAHHITIQNSTYQHGIYLRDASYVTLNNNDLGYSPNVLILNDVHDFEVTNNYIHDTTEDLMRITGDSYNGLVENNVFRDSLAVYPAHSDGLQFLATNGNSPHDMVIRGNYFYDDPNTGESGRYMQGIFVKDGVYKNFLIEQNLLAIGSPNTIYVWTGSENFVIRNNTLLSWTSGGSGASIRLDGSTNPGVTIDGNVMRGLINGSGDSTIGNNLIYSDNSANALYWGNLFSGPGSTWQGFVPKTGSPIDFGTPYGAQARLLELMGQAPPPPTISTLTNGSCGTTQNSCAAGSLSDTADTSSNYLWQCTGTNGGSTASCTLAKPSSAPPTSSFAIGNRIQLINNTNVRTEGVISSATLLGTQPVGTQGTLVAGPTQSSANIYTWWQVDYDSGVDGWSGEDNFTLISSPPNPINGTCGITENACIAGTLNDTTDTSSNYLWQCVGQNGGTTASCSLAKSTTPPTSATFITGSTVQANTPGSNLNVRATPNGTLLGTQANGATGTVIGGPTYANNLWWWNINFTSGADGWAAESFLTSYTPPASSGGGGGSSAPPSSGGGTPATSGGGGGGGGSAPTISSGGSSASANSGGGGGSPSTSSTGSTGSPRAGSGQAIHTPEYTEQLLALINQLKTLIALLKSLGGTVSPELEAMVNAYPDSPVPSASSGATGQTFTRNLTIGSRGEDVRQLQLFLNREGFTVSPTAGGSPGNETTYFGTKTRDALIRYQNAYAEQILHPLNLTRGTGYFGPSTIRYIKNHE